MDSFIHALFMTGRRFSLRRHSQPRALGNSPASCLACLLTCLDACLSACLPVTCLLPCLFTCLFAVLAASSFTFSLPLLLFFAFSSLWAYSPHLATHLRQIDKVRASFHLLHLPPAFPLLSSSLSPPLFPNLFPGAPKLNG